VDRSRRDGTRGARGKSVTIVDVARRAGVSKSTVSNVLRGVAVSPELAGRVRAVIEELGYAPSVFAQSLARQRTHALAAFVPQLGNPFYADLLSGVEHETVARGYRLLISSAEDDIRGERQMLRMLLQYRPAGYIIAGLRDEGAVQNLIERKLPLVFLDTHRVPESAGLVMLDDRLGMRLAVGHLVELGHRRIASVIDSDLDPARDQRLQGYLEGLAEAGIESDPRLRVRDQPAAGSREPAPRPTVVDELLALDDPPTAIVAGDDLGAIGLIDSLETRGVRVPEQMSVVGFDDIAISRVSRIALTTVRQPALAMGRRAATIMVDHLESDAPEELGRYREIVEPELVIRRTTAPPPR
jgi:LacI family transcriptional regulator, galactose operon repressor